MCRYCNGDLFASSSDLTQIRTNVLIRAAQCAEMPEKLWRKKKREKKSEGAALHNNLTQVKVLLNYQVECAKRREEQRRENGAN